MTVCAVIASVDAIEASANLHAPQTMYRQAETIAEVLHARALGQPNDIALAYLGFGDDSDTLCTYAELDRAACQIACRLAQIAAEGATDRPQRFVLAFPPCAEFAHAYFGILYSGGEAVNVFAPDTPRESAKLCAIVEDCAPAAILTHSSTLEAVRTLLRQNALGHVPVVATDDFTSTDSDDRLLTAQRPRSENCFIQYTSGSTSSPKGVQIRHANLLHNLSVIDHYMHGSGIQRYLGLVWLPVFHDMGLVAGLNYPIFIGRPHIMFSHKAFMQRPQRWIEQIARFRATHTGGPNFAFELCARFAERVGKDALDLSSLRFALCGAEPIRSTTLARFAVAYAPCGLDPDAIAPAYGLAESTLMVTGTAVGEGRRIVVADRFALTKGAFAEITVDGAGDPQDALKRGRVLVSSGRACPLHDVRIVDPTRHIPLPDRQIGEIWVRSPSVAGGYLDNPEASADTFGGTLADSTDGHLRTGDLGFLDCGHLFVTGRSKDLIILNGSNHHAQDIEAAIDGLEMPEIRRSAAFSIADSAEREAVAAICEIRAARPQAELEALANKVAKQLFRAEGLAIAELALVAKGSIPRTSSGKLQRQAAKKQYLQGKMSVFHVYRTVRLTENKSM